MTRKSRIIRWTPRAVADLKSIAAYIAQDSPQTARRFAARLKRRAESVTEMPSRGRVLPELSREDVREVLEGNYRIVYRVQAQTIDILTIFEGHRLFRP